jgi:hypothetical protein
MIVDGGRELISNDYRNRSRSDCDWNPKKKVWEECLEYRSYVCSNTALDIFDFDEQVPEMAMMGQQADISPWCDFQWYQ